MRKTAHYTAAVAGVLMMSVHATPCQAKPAEQPDPVKISAAVPEKPPAVPKSPRKILVFSVTRGFHHASIPWGVASIVEMGRKTGAFTAVPSDDLANFEADKINGFDAIVFNNTTQNVFMPSKEDLAAMDEAGKAAAKERDLRLRKNLLDFIRSGKGFVGIHAATDTFYDWEEYGFMIGAYFDGHPWTAGHDVSIKVEKRDHPINACMHDITHLEFKEECYQFRSPYEASRQDILLRLDTEKTDMTKVDATKIKRTDKDFPLSWVRTFGKGRVYYSALGHNMHIYENPRVVAHYLAGIQWAIGDLAAPPPPGDP